MAKVKIGMTRKNATDKLKKVRYLMDDVEIMQKRRAFINKFVHCEGCHEKCKFDKFK